MISLPVINLSKDPDVLIFNVDHIKILRDRFGILGTLIGTLPHYPQQNVFLLVPLRLMIWEVIWLVEQGEAELVDYLKYRESKRIQELVDGHSEVELSEGTDIGKENKASNLIHLDKSGSQSNAAPNYITTSNDVPIVNPSTIPLEEYIHNFIKKSGMTDVKLHYQTYKRLKSSGYFILPGLKFGGDLVIYPGDPLKFHSSSIVKFNVVEVNDIVVSGRLATSVKKSFVVVHESEKEEDIRFFPIQWAGFG